MTDAQPDVRPTVVAAGGVVLDGDGDRLRVLVVHRPAYDDWSLPKGHLDAGESPEQAAVREVQEETGVLATIDRPVGTTEHAVRLVEGEVRKRVHWYVMRPAVPGGDPTLRAPDDEVDRAAWWSVPTALASLTHAGERALLSRALEETGGGA